MKRRSFLKVVLGAASAAAVTLPEMKASAAPAPAAKVVRSVNQGKIREIVQYDLAWDRWVARWDIAIWGQQLGVDSACDCIEAAERGWPSYEPWLDRVRPVMRGLLEEKLKHIGATFDDCLLLPFPDGLGHRKYV